MIERLINEAEGAEPAGGRGADRQPGQDRRRARRGAGAGALDRRRACSRSRSRPTALDAAAALETALGRAGRPAPASSGSPTASITTARRAPSPTGSPSSPAAAPSPSSRTRPGKEALGAVAGLGQRRQARGAVLRAGGGAARGLLHAFSARGQRLGEAPFQLGRRARPAPTATFELPLELRNQVTRVEIAGERSAGAVSLLDARSQWHRVGLLSGESREQAQPLLAPLYYLQKALAPFSELVRAEGLQPRRRHRHAAQAERHAC